MSFETDADRLAMLQALGGETVTFIGAVSGLPTNEGLTALFLSPFEMAAFGGIEYESAKHMARVLSSAVVGAVHKDILMRGTDQFEIIKIEPDGSGITDLYLRKS